MPNSPVPLGEVFAGKYRVDRILGEGGMGVVVAAHHLELDQPVAIKFLLDDLAGHAEGAERFRREARAAAKIQSDHVVRVLDVGVLDDGVRYMVMEYMKGRDLAEEITDKGMFPAGVAAGFILQALDAVGHAHAVGIVHRDLKPANLFLVERPDGSKRVKVLDFGISKSVGNATASELSLTKTSAWIGSPLYMAPEQMQSARDVDHRADIWSMGAILFELVSGRTPYQAESLPQLCNQLITEDPPNIKDLVPSVPDGLAKAIMGCLVRDRESRTQTTADLARELSAYATTITGSGLGASILAQTEVHSGASGSLEAPVMSAPVPSIAQGAGASSTVQSASSPISDSTKSAWGGTDSEESKPKSKVGFIIGGVAAAALLGFFLMSRGGPDEVLEESPVAATEEHKLDEEGAAESPSALDSEEETAAAEKAETEEPSSAPAEEAAPEKQEEPEPVVAPQPAPQPVVAPRPRPSAPRPAPAPQPTAAPAPKDDFADFGGRN